jgi:hypothetical protein
MPGDWNGETNQFRANEANAGLTIPPELQRIIDKVAGERPGRDRMNALAGIAQGVGQMFGSQKVAQANLQHAGITEAGATERQRLSELGANTRMETSIRPQMETLKAQTAPISSASDLLKKWGVGGMNPVATPANPAATTPDLSSPAPSYFKSNFWLHD